MKNVLASRYASQQMVDLWSAEARVVMEREFWIALLKAQEELGFDVPEGVVDDYLAVVSRVDLVSIRERVMETADVGYLPGPNFAPDGASGRNYARLCFGYCQPEEIREGIARLAEAFEKEGVAF